MSLRYPELPEPARPHWPPWYAPAALLGTVGALVVFLPAIPIILLGHFSEDMAALSLLVLLIVQDSILAGAALLFGSLKMRLRPWHFGLRPTRPWPAIGWTLLGFGVLFGFELGYIAIFGVDETNVQNVGGGAVIAATLVALAVIVVAPVSEEFFFRAFFYCALRSRLPVWAAAAVDGLVFGALHFESADTAIILPVIAVFGAGQCLVYERTGSLFAVIAIHAAFNTVASLGGSPVPALAIGALVVLGCLIVPRRLPVGASPVLA